jgi:hypothetical protein
VTGGLLVAGMRYAAGIPTPVTASVLVACLAVSACDVFGRHGLTFPLRQTYGAALAYVGPGTAQLIWGFDIGLGFTTFRVSRAYWVALMILVAGAPAGIGLLGAVAYSAALFAGVKRNRTIFVPEERLIRRRRGLGIAALGVSAVVLGITLAG